MDKDVRNLLITGVVACVVGIIMGIGVVAPSVEPVTVVYEDTECKQELQTCEALSNEIYEQALIAQKNARDALNLVDRCINAVR